jgi:hypothetical protein
MGYLRKSSSINQEKATTVPEEGESDPPARVGRVKAVRRITANPEYFGR